MDLTTEHVADRNGSDRHGSRASPGRVFDMACGVALVVGAVYVVTLLPGVRSTAGYDPLLDGWLNGVADATVLAAVFARSFLRPRERAAWLFLAAGLATALAASVGYYAYYQYLDQRQEPSWSDVGWIAFYPLLYIGLMLLLRARVREMLRSLWLDGLIAGLTAASLGVAYLGLLSGTEGFVGVGLLGLYPIADLLLLAATVAVVVILGRSADLSWLLVFCAFLIWVATDVIYTDQVATGTYVSGGILDLGWAIPRLCLVGAAFVSARRSASLVVRTGGASVVAVPAVCLLASLGVLFHGTYRPIPPAATALAFAVGLAVILRTITTFREVSQLSEARRLLRTDDLTGLTSRRYFHQVLDKASQQMHRHPLGVIVLDLNGFKQTNDTLGHEAGDEVLRQMGERLALHGRSHDVVCRLGGDEFALLLIGASPTEARHVAEDLREAIRQPLAIGAASVLIDASFGIAHGPTDSTDGRDLLRMADVAMYSAKQGRLGLECFDSRHHGATMNRLERAAELREALQLDQLFLVYQPQVAARTGATVGVEALVRWQHPTHGLLTPDAFIGLAESAGLMGLLTLDVLGKALGQRRQWALEGLPLRIAVNVSPSVLSGSTFSGDVAHLLSVHVVDGSALTLEITEELLLSEHEAAVRSMERLTALGVRFSIDDYGTGYASLGYLKDLPVAEIKLDRQFVSDMARNSSTGTIVRSTIDLAHALGLNVVAEGVEDEETLQLLADAGTDEFQGNFLSKPVADLQVPSAARAASSRCR